MSISVKNHNPSADPLNYEDNTCILPDSIFPDLDRAHVQLFVQDAKVDPKTGKIKTCEFGLGLASGGWSLETMRKIVKILNKYAPIWLMADQNYLEFVKRSDGENAFANLLVKAMKENSDSNLLKPDFLHKILKKGPTAYSEEQKFNPDAISNYCAIGVCPYNNVPSKNLRNIKHPPILWLDNVSGTGPPLKTLSHKHLSRLMMNGTEAQEQNPPFLLIETRYKPGLASFLKRRFPDDQKLMLKHVAASRGEGVIELDASSEKSLDKALAEHLSDKSSFRQKSPISVCLIEKFISTPEKKDNELKETIFRFMYLVIKNNNEVKVHLVGGVKCFGKSSCNSSGIVKLNNRYNDGTIQVLKNDDLSKIRERISREIACVAKRAICYDPDKAVQYFLSSDSHILNLVGLELFAPHLTCSYREFVQPKHCSSYQYVTDQQCDLFLSLLQRNKSEIVRELILENIIRAEWEQMKEKFWFVPAAKLSSLLEQLIVDSPTEAFKLKCRKFLIKLYMDIFKYQPSSREAKNFILKSLDLMQSEFPETFRNIHTHSWVNYFETYCLPDFEPSFNWSYPLSQEDFLKTNVPCIPRDLYIQLLDIYNGHRRYNLDLFPLRNCLVRIKKEEPFEKNWEQREWKEFFEWIKNDKMKCGMAKMKYVRIFIISILPEILKLGWSVSQLKEIVNKYLESQWAQYEAKFPFKMLFIALSQIKGTDKDKSFRFFQSFIKYYYVTRENYNCFNCLREYILFQVINQGQNVNAVLESMTNRFTELRKGNTASFVKAVEKVIEIPEPM